ncbi:hypothetical protein Tco_0812648 [Tanacetum coccineum]
MFIKSRIYLDDEYVVMTRNYFLQYTQIEIREFRDTLIQHMEYVKKSIDKRALHKREYDSRVNERQMQTTEEKVDTSKSLDASLVNTESSRTKSRKQDTSNSSGNDVDDDDADIKPVYDEEPMAEVQLTAKINVLATGQQHSEQPEFNNEREPQTNGSKPKHRSNTQTFRNWPASKNSFVTIKCDTIGTLMATKPKLDADLSGKLVDQTNYRSKIGSLVYLTSSRPDIVQAVCYCACYQARPTEKHLKEVKRIFRYLRGTINMGLWYPKNYGFKLTTFLDVDHVGCLDTHKSNYGGIQFLGDKLVSWMSKKQDCTSMSSTEAEYVALSASCAQEMWTRTQLKDNGFNYNKYRCIATLSQP